jgi:3-methyl-2-oxobutanoate hydroxymethyltransferase
MLTAYDYPFAKLLDESGIDIILVGDSLGMVALGYADTTSVTMQDMIHHAKAVRRAVKRALLVGDMPLDAFGASVSFAVSNALRFVEEAGCDAVKIEWKEDIASVAKAIVDRGVPVMGHVGLTPQTAVEDGGFKVRAKEADSALNLFNQALSLQEAGCFSIVLECVPALVAKEVTARLKIPTIGIGAGPSCDGQVLVTNDILGLFDAFRPKFVKNYTDLSAQTKKAIDSYVTEVKSGAFPAKENAFSINEQELSKFKAGLGLS